MEFAFTLGTDLKASDAPYSRRAIMNALETWHPAIEVSDSRYCDWTSIGAPNLIANNGNDGIFVFGSGQRSIFTESWQKPDAAAYSATRD